MAKHFGTHIFPIFLLCAVLLFASLVNGLGGVVGGRTKIEDVKANQQVQHLGKYSVQEYNRGQRQKGNGGDLKFTEVVEAEKQVVSGVKYYLKIAAATANGVPKVFDAVVVVKPWARSTELLNFEPSPATK